MKYIKFIYPNYPPTGLLHLTVNLKYLLKYPYDIGKTPIIPKFTLGERVGLGSEKVFDSNLSEYYDYSNVKINGEPYKVLVDDNNLKEDDVEIFNCECREELPSSNYFPTNSNFNKLVGKNIDIELPIQKYLVESASKITELLRKYVCVHVRRGDLLKLEPESVRATESKNILKVLDEVVDESYCVYIMTNETDLSLFDDITEKYNTYFWTEFDELKKWYSKSNYLLFAIELLILKNANKKISTMEKPYGFGVGYCDKWLF